MGYAVVHMMKIKSGAVGGIQSHNNREHAPKTNPDVDTSRSGENYHLVSCDNYRAAIKERLKEHLNTGKAVRKDAVVVCNFIVTSDQQTMEELGAEKQRAFFEDAVKWFLDRYGAHTVLNATVHMDETTPHLHIGIVPITADGRLSAKAIFTKIELKNIQTDFAREVGERYGLERGVEGSERTHLSEMRFKAETAMDMANEMCAVAEIAAVERDEATQELAEARQSLSRLQGEVKSLQDEKAALEGDIAALRAKEIHIRDNEIPAIAKRLGELKETVTLLDTAVKRKMDEGAAQFGSMGAMQQRIAEARKEAERRNRLSLLEKFIELPQVKPAWEKFCEMVNKRSRGRTEPERK